MRAVLAVIVVAACAAHAPTPAPAPPPPVVHADPPPPPPTPFDDAMKQIAAFKDQMCRCADTACTQQVMNDITTWGSQWQKEHPDWKGTDEENRQIGEVVQPMMECMQKASGSAPSP